MRILITGSRNFSDENLIRRLFTKIKHQAKGKKVTIVSGNCPTGADAICEKVAESLGFEVERYPADWEKYGRAAGPKRNQTMVDAGAKICLAFPTSDSIGTYDCIRRAKKAGIETKIFNT